MAMPTGLWVVRGLQRHSGLEPELVLRTGRFQLQPSPELHRGRRDAQVARMRLLQLHDGVELRWRCRRGYGVVRGLQRHGGLGPELVLRAGRFQLQPGPCGSCNCMTEWNYDGDGDGVMEAYEGCSATADWDQSWCYVQVRLLQLHDGVELRWRCRRGYGVVRGLQRHGRLALDSTVAGETRKWLECTPSTPSPTPAPDIESASGVGEPTMTAAIIAVILSTACA
ncbi:unnamed protein product [Prorocentrum cordatum]|uniref:Uncharacterized protein n=1 Tax=Prorocentrum cordatum TaxID=2364126 RepID=A0ABN9PB53_9DINO|nr:unnamed protein product [Polarella glacialis]